MGRGRSSSGGGSRGSSSSGGRGRSSSSYGRSSGGVRVYSYHSYHHGDGSSVGSGKGIMIFMAVIFLLFGIGALIGSISMYTARNDYATVQAEAIENEYSMGWYYTTYEYVIDDVLYENRSDVGWEFPEKIGKIVEIYYDKDDPNWITEERPYESTGTVLVVAVFGIIFSSVGVMLIVMASKVKKEQVEQKSSSKTISSISEPQDRYCTYCGSKISKTADTCPKCGAGQK